MKEKSAKYIKKLRKLTGLSQKEFGNKIGTTRGYISQLENDRVNISLSNFLEYCNIFDIKPNKILK